MTNIEIQMRFADVDMLGHVNNVNLQHYFDLGKSDYFQKVLDLKIPMSELGLIVKSTHNVYMAQVFYGSRIAVRTWTERVGTTSIVVKQVVYDCDNDEIKAESESVMVCYDFVGQLKRPLPDAWRQKLDDIINK